MLGRKLHIKVGDNVFITTGINKGKKAEVISINRKSERVTVRGLEGESLAGIKKHVKPNADRENPEGGIIEKDPTIHISNLMHIDPKSGEPTRIGTKRVEAKVSGKTKTLPVRYAVKSKEDID